MTAVRTTRSASARAPATVAEGLVAALAARGVKVIYGLPGGRSSLDLLAAARAQGVGFVLARHESAAAMMAAAHAELSGAVVAVLTTKGPGVGNVANGVAHACLDRAPVVVVTEGVSAEHLAFATHQMFDQRGMLAPVVKAHSRLEGDDAGDEIERLLATALRPRQGPVHIELTGPAARAPLRTAAPAVPEPLGIDDKAVASARAMLARARRPVVVAGLEARGCADAVRGLVEALGCPALVTYKAKGVVADTHPQFGGIFTGGAAEQPLVRQSDLIVLAGVDPVEFVLQPWPYACPVLEVGWTPHPLHYVKAACTVHGDIAGHLQRIGTNARKSAWTLAEIADLRGDMFAALRYRGGREGMSPEAVVRIAAEAAEGLRRWPRVTVDAGAHMFSATAFWPCQAPNDLLISNGLASMGFALPAAIASARFDPRRTTIAFTGDGGLLMCLGDLATAAQQRAPVVVVVFNDGALSLIDIKQKDLALPPRAVRWERPDFAAVARGFGGRGFRVSTVTGYRRALRAGLEAPGLTVIDVAIDASGYARQLAALRG